jgi:hypothetical protein
MNGLLVISAIWMSLVVTSGDGPNEQRAKLTAAELEAKRQQLTKITKGMTEEDVRGLLGEPDEVRSKRRAPWIAGAELEWVYGVDRPGEFASIGLVLFDADGRVFQACSPTSNPFVCSPPGSLFAEKGAEEVPLSEKAIRTPTDVHCQLGSVVVLLDLPKQADGRRDQWVGVSLINDGTEAFHYEGAFNHLFVVEIYDADKRLLSRLDRRTVASTFGRRALPPGERKEGGFPLWFRDVYFGAPSPGTYYVRALFRDGDRKYYPSNLLEFQVAKLEQGGKPKTP